MSQAQGKGRGSRKTNGLAQQVASRAGVSLMTVSRVFSGSARVSETTRQRVLEEARKVGYQPNSAARALRRGTSMNIAYMMTAPDGMVGYYHSSAIAAFENKVSRHGYHLTLLAPRHPEGIFDMIRNLVASSSCRAVVVRFDIFPEDDIDQLEGLQAPIIFASSAPKEILEDHPFSSVCFDNKMGVAQAVRYLWTLGHRRIAFLGGTVGWFDSVQREEGFLSTMQELDIPIRRDWMRNCLFTHGYQNGHDSMNAIFAKTPDTPTAVVCASDEIAAGAMAAANIWGKRIPQEFSVVGFDNNHWTEYITPRLTTVRHNGWDLGASVGDLMLRQLDDPNLRNVHWTLDTSLVVRESTGPAPA